MDTLRVWTGGTDTTLPDFSTPIGGQIGAPPTPAASSSYFPTAASLRTLTPSWLPFVGEGDSAQQENECFPSLSWTQRVIGFVILLLIGILFCAFVRSCNSSHWSLSFRFLCQFSVLDGPQAWMGLFFSLHSILYFTQFWRSITAPNSENICFIHFRAQWSSLFLAHSPSTTLWEICSSLEGAF